MDSGMSGEAGSSSEIAKRAPKMGPQQRACIQRVLRQLASGAAAGGMTAVVRRCLEEPVATGATMAAMRQRLQADTYEAWAVRIKKWQPLLPVVTAAGLSKAEAAAYQFRAARILEDLPSPEEAARILAADGAANGVADRATAALGKVKGKQRAAAVGRREYLQPNVVDERTRAAASAPTIAEWEPPLVARESGAVEALPARAEPYRPTRSDQQRQLCKVKQWKLKRALKKLGTDDAYFSIGAVDKAVRAWRRESGADDDATPPVQLIVENCQTEVLLAMTTSESGHLWSVAEEGPLDAGQLLAAMETEWTAEEVRELIRQGLSESKMRQLIGQATHGGATAVATQRLVGRMRQGAHGQHAWHRGTGRTIGMVGSGMGLTGLQVAAEIEGRVAWMADSCEVAHAAGGKLVRAAGHRPKMFFQAEDPELSSVAHRVGVEVITLGCAQYSNAGDGTRVEAALNEARVVMESVAARRPGAIIFETSAGLWHQQRADVRRRLEGLLQNAAGYEWEAAKISPHLHCGGYSRRSRVFYMGVRRDLLRDRHQVSTAVVAAEEIESVHRGGAAATAGTLTLRARDEERLAVGRPADWTSVAERPLCPARAFGVHGDYASFPVATVYQATLLTGDECRRIVELARSIGVSLSSDKWRREDAESTLTVSKVGGHESTWEASLELLRCAFAVHGRACAMAQAVHGTQGVTVAEAPRWKEMPGASRHDRLMANLTEWNKRAQYNMNIIRYTAEGPDPSWHRDASPLAFVVPLLYDGVQSGGGTEYAFLSESGRQETVSPSVGTMVMHAGDAVHRGVPIVARPGEKGERWILTGFLGAVATRARPRTEPPFSRGGDLAALAARWRGAGSRGAVLGASVSAGASVAGPSTAAPVAAEEAAAALEAGRPEPKGRAAGKRKATAMVAAGSAAVVTTPREAGPLTSETDNAWHMERCLVTYGTLPERIMAHYGQACICGLRNCVCGLSVPEAPTPDDEDSMPAATHSRSARRAPRGSSDPRDADSAAFLHAWAAKQDRAMEALGRRHAAGKQAHLAREAAERRRREEMRALASARRAAAAPGEHSARPRELEARVVREWLLGEMAEATLAREREQRRAAVQSGGSLAAGRTPRVRATVMGQRLIDQVSSGHDEAVKRRRGSQHVHLQVVAADGFAAAVERLTQAHGDEGLARLEARHCAALPALLRDASDRDRSVTAERGDAGANAAAEEEVQRMRDEGRAGVRIGLLQAGPVERVGLLQSDPARSTA